MSQFDRALVLPAWAGLWKDARPVRPRALHQEASGLRDRLTANTPTAADRIESLLDLPNDRRVLGVARNSELERSADPSDMSVAEVDAEQIRVFRGRQ
jgi:hypothetical protein